MTELNMQNRTLAIMDNLPFLRSLNNLRAPLLSSERVFTLESGRQR